jgi:hypothetical protein
MPAATVRPPQFLSEQSDPINRSIPPSVIPYTIPMIMRENALTPEHRFHRKEYY